MPLMKQLSILIILAILAASAPGISAATPRKAKAKRESAAELFHRAQAAFNAYQFDEAIELAEQASDALPAKGSAEVTEAEIDQLAEVAERGRLMLDRVEKIVIIDSISVGAERFFEAYRLDPAAGALRPASTLPRSVEASEGSPVYVTESGLTMYWAMPDTAGHTVIAEASILADGSAEPPLLHTELSAPGSDDLFPFLMADGVTLYYATDNPDISLGGLDIVFTRRNGSEFLQPQNMGMPYNSPANDYLLAIDEATGTGWWGTDRNHPSGDTITIYRFIPNELRVNYPSGDENITSLARLTDFRATQPAGADYSALLSLPAAGSKTSATADDFSLSIPGRGIITSLKDLKSSSARREVRQWVDLRAKLADEEARLASLRSAYASGRTNVAPDILATERSLPALRARIKESLNNIIRLETGN